MTICELSTSGTTTLTQGTWEQCDIVRQEESGVHGTLMSPTAALIALTDVGDDPRSQGWCIHGTLRDPRTQGCVWRCIDGTLSDPGTQGCDWCIHGQASLSTAPHETPWDICPVFWSEPLEFEFHCPRVSPGQCCEKSNSLTGRQRESSKLKVCVSMSQFLAPQSQCVLYQTSA